MWDPWREFIKFMNMNGKNDYAIVFHSPQTKI